jgi:hypothetical protein
MDEKPAASAAAPNVARLVEKDARAKASIVVSSPEKSVSENVTADVAVSNDKVSLELLPSRVDAEPPNKVVEEKVNFAMAI